MTLEDESKKCILDEIAFLNKDDVVLKDSIKKIYDVIPILIAVSTFDEGRFISVNQAWLDLFKYTREEVIGSTSRELDIFIDMEERQKMARMILQNGIVREQEIKVRTKTGRILTGQFSGDLFSSSDEKVLITTMIDITEKKIQQEQLIKAEAEKEKNEFLKKTIEMRDDFTTLISHEFKTPITIITSAIQTLEFLCRNELPDKARKFLNIIRKNSNRQLKLVNNLLDISRMNAGQLKIEKENVDIVSLTSSITDSIKIYAEQKNIQLSFTSTLSKRIIGIDVDKYDRILLNLLSNAIKFTPRNKSISVRVSLTRKHGKSAIKLQVIDNGIGIPEDMKDLIFERFGQVDSSLARQAEGTGVGLYLVKMLVEMMDGQIDLESKEGIGSTFTIHFPAVKIKSAHAGQRIEEASDNRLIKSIAIEFSDVYI